MAHDRSDASLAVVIIGRNEGERLVRCLESLKADDVLLIYVDSGSSDNSVSEAARRNARVVELDVTKPFTAARARNAGVEKIKQLGESPKYIQFVDGDCEVAPLWIETSVAYLEAHPNVAAVCGQRRERFPEASVYNQLCDYEWRKPEGRISSFGGDVLIRAEALDEAGGYRNSLIAGEEPELSLRLRRIGWELRALEDSMTLHDANMTTFRQWWRRMKRSGYAYAAGAHLHGHAEERHFVRQAIQAWVWVPLPMSAALMLIWMFGPIGSAVLLIYPLQALRLYLKFEGSNRKRFLLAASYTLVRFPEFAGQLSYIRDLIINRKPELIEYK